MPVYSGIQKEETLKGLVYKDFFSEFGYEPNIDNIDFVTTDQKTRADLFSDGIGSSRHYLWAEAKKGVVDEVSMLTQLVLTCKKTYDSGVYLPPPFIGCFDAVKIAFLPFHDILPIFAENDINWNVAPSNYLSDDFIKIRKKMTKLIAKHIVVYTFDEDATEIKRFIKTHFIPGAVSSKSPITKNNFPHIYNRWLKEVKPTINVSADRWQKYKKEGILDCDFFRADMMSKNGTSITERLKIILENDKYKLQKDIEGELFKTDINFTDEGAAYRRFWNKYERPPAEEYQQYIIDRRDLLVPQNIREIKGSFFTPAVWVEKSQEYLEKVFGENWQDEYYIWDCAAGTGNLLAGLVNQYNVWASTIDQPDVDTMHALIDEGFNLLHDHVFQFDFLNDSFDKLPKALQKIIDDPKKRKKLIVYINPPYAEVSSKDVKGKVGVNQSKTHDKYASSLGTAGRELFAQFLMRIYFEIQGCKIGEFSTLKVLNGPAFESFRNFFIAKLESCFIMPAYTFDNVNGKFPTGFKIWDTDKNEKFEEISADVFDEDNHHIGQKTFCNFSKKQIINNWISEYKKFNENPIGFMDGINGNDFQHNNIVYICNTKEQLPNPRGIWVTDRNLFEIAIYFFARHCFEHTWINHNDQFLYPNDIYKGDDEFKNDCLIYTLFHAKNAIQSRYGVNHWIPFTEKQVQAREKFESNFMSSFLKNISFSEEAKAVLTAGLELWKYYHKKTKGNNTVSVNASFYDIRAFFQGRNATGNMNVTSTDETYNTLIKTLRKELKLLSQKIEPKVYEYGFLKE